MIFARQMVVSHAGHEMSVLAAAAIRIALVMDFLLLPPLLVFLDREKAVA